MTSGELKIVPHPQRIKQIFQIYPLNNNDMLSLSIFQGH